MTRWEPIVAVFAGIALVWGYGSALLADVAGLSPLVAPASTAVVAGAFGWTRRGHDAVDAIATAFGVCFAAYAGLAAARVPHPNVIADQWRLMPLGDQLPAVVLGGIPFALVFAIFIALPVSLIPLRRRGAPVEDRLGAFIAEYHPECVRGEAPKPAP